MCETEKALEERQVEICARFYENDKLTDFQVTINSKQKKHEENYTKIKRCSILARNKLGENGIKVSTERKESA